MKLLNRLLPSATSLVFPRRLLHSRPTALDLKRLAPQLQCIRYNSTSTTPLPKPKLSTYSTTFKILISTALLLTGGGIYIVMNKSSLNIQPTTESQPLEAIDCSDLPQVKHMLTDDQIISILTKNQLLFNMNHDNQSSGPAPVVRIDANSVASNQPIEDYYAHVKFGNGVLLGMFDGHGGPECGKIVQKYLLAYVAQSITELGLPSKPDLPESSPDRHRLIKKALKSAFTRLDADITQGAFTTYGNVANQVTSKGTIASWVLGLPAFTRNECIASLRTALSGACAIVAYIDGEDVYVACTGDCRAIIGRSVDYSPDNSKAYLSVALSADQTFKNPKEYARLMDEHPGEDVIVKGRILGGLMPTRAFGDARYKWSIRDQRVILPSLYPDGRRGIPRHYKTPPYVTAEPEVIHYVRDKNDKFIVLATDGLWDELDEETCVKVVGGSYEQGNAATALMLSALSAGRAVPDRDRIRHILSIPRVKSRRYRDDITINVAYFDHSNGMIDFSTDLDTDSAGDTIQGGNVKPVDVVDLKLAGPKRHHFNSWVQFLYRQPPPSSDTFQSKL
ncbi:hypothetical protein O5D80_001964 [Batrachochytrium dendrobatidis]|nr:hypothetical protein O5D80_001964 [Batrachochytrium dendrobatidis]